MTELNGSRKLRRLAETMLVVALVGLAAGCGSSSPAPAAVSCRDWQEKTDARETLRSELVPRFRQAGEDEFDGKIPPEVSSYFTDEALRDAVDDAVEKACAGEAADFMPYEKVLETET